MAPHSSILAWKIPWMEEPGRLQSMGSLRVRHDWATSLSLFTFMHWRRKWQPTPVFLPGESQGRGSLVGCHLWGHTDLDMLKWLSSSSKNTVSVKCSEAKYNKIKYTYKLAGRNHFSACDKAICKFLATCVYMWGFWAKFKSRIWLFLSL